MRCRLTGLTTRIAILELKCGNLTVFSQFYHAGALRQIG
jgi:hypothetical protein